MENKPSYEELQRRIKALQRDAVERKRAAGALRENGKRYRVLVENANDAIFVTQDNVIKFPNPKTEDMIGYSADELLGIPFTELVHPDDREMVAEKNNGTLNAEELPDTYAFRIIDRDGEELWVQLNPVPITWGDQPAILNVLRDITSQKRIEAKLEQAQKMEAIGALASGIAQATGNPNLGKGKRGHPDRYIFRTR